jgi:hypothetical protein
MTYTGHLSSRHHDKITPLLAEIMLKVQQHVYFTRALSREEKTAKGQRSFFNLEERNVIMNGIICPVWNMPNCPQNDVGNAKGGTHKIVSWSASHPLQAQTVSK